jgi:hypothetical protein
MSTFSKKIKLTKTAVDNAEPVVTGDGVRQRALFDTGLSGFGVVVGVKTKTFSDQRGNRRVTIGRYGLLTVDEARKRAIDDQRCADGKAVIQCLNPFTPAAAAARQGRPAAGTPVPAGRGVPARTGGRTRSAAPEGMRTVSLSRASIDTLHAARRAAGPTGVQRHEPVKRGCRFIELFSCPLVAILEVGGCAHSSPPMNPSRCSRLVKRLKIDTYRLTVAMM